MDYRVTLNGTTLTNQPDGLEQMSLTLDRDTDIPGLYYRYTSQLTFVGDGYTILKALFDGGICSLVTTKIEWRCDPEGGFVTLFNGLISITKVTFNLSDCTAKTSVTDDTISARIANNWRLKGILSTDKSINKTTITPATETPLDLFIPSTGTYSATNRESYTVFEAFRFLVDFVTNGTVDFASTTFDAGGTWQYLMVATGKAIRQTAIDSAPEISLADLFDNVNKKIPLGMIVEYDAAGSPTLRIETRDQLYTTTNLMTCRSIQGETGLEALTYESELYGSVKFGTATTTPQGGSLAYPDPRWQGWSEEEYNFNTDCNLDNQLDLVTEWLCDSNTIEDILVALNDQYDDDVFLIHAFNAEPDIQAIKYTDGIATNYYNRELTNYKVATRWSDYIPSSFSKWLELSTVDNQFQANVGTPPSPAVATSILGGIGANPFPFDTEDYDNGGNYDAVTNFRYTTPTAGLYRFRVFTDVDFSNKTIENTNLEITVNIERRNSSGTLQETVSATRSIPYSRDDDQWYHYADMICAASDRITAYYTARTIDGSGAVTVSWTSLTEFACTTAPSTFIEFDQPTPARLRMYRFSYPMTKAQWDTISTNPKGTITINPGKDSADDVVTHIRQITYQVEAGLANFETIA